MNDIVSRECKAAWQAVSTVNRSERERELVKTSAQVISNVSLKQHIQRTISNNNQ